MKHLVAFLMLCGVLFAPIAYAGDHGHYDRDNQGWHENNNHDNSQHNGWQPPSNYEKYSYRPAPKVFRAPPPWYNNRSYNQSWYNGPHWGHDDDYWINRECREFWHNGRYVRSCRVQNDTFYYVPKYQNNNIFWFQIPGLTIGIK